MTVESVLAHGLKTSVFGSQWNAEYGDNLALLDPDRIKSDLLANRPAAGVAHRFFFATDNQKLYYDTGAAWAEQSAATAMAHAASHAGGGADAITLAQSQVTNLTADLAGKEPANANIQAHIASAANPHAVTKTQVGLGNADNTSDAAKPVSTAAQTALNLKANDSAVPHLTGPESIGGVKSFADMVKFSRGVQVASAAALNLSNEDGIYFNITGTAGITSISTRGATGTGAAKGILPLVMLKFDGILTLTHSASLILPGAANLTTYAGLVLTFVEESAGVWRCIGRASGRPAFRAHRNAVAQTIATATFTKIAFNTKSYDFDGTYDAVTNYRFTPVVPGYYKVTVKFRFASGSFAIGDTLKVVIYKNGAAYSTFNHFVVYTGTNAPSLLTEDDVAMNGATDYLEAYAYQNSGGNRDIRGEVDETSFAACRIGDA